jgi:hypothetical protein
MSSEATRLSRVDSLLAEAYACPISQDPCLSVRCNGVGRAIFTIHKSAFFAGLQ